MGSHSFTSLHCPNNSKMVAAQVMKCLWVASLAVAAPQLDFGVQRAGLTSVAAPGGNQQQIVSNVVLALQPSIAEAMAAALRSSSVSSRPRPVVSTNSLSNAVSVNSVEENYGPAKYNYEYKVADKEDQTYISQNEQRDGDSVTGSYSYVAPNGDLITVNYEAGPMGYTATTDKQEGFVAIKERNSGVKRSGSAKTSTRGSSFTAKPKSSSSASSSLTQADLIARIISSLQPQIQSAVSSALRPSSRSTTTLVEQPRISSVSNGLEGTFGNGQTSVNIATPEFQIAY